MDEQDKPTDAPGEPTVGDESAEPFADDELDESFLDDEGAADDDDGPQLNLERVLKISVVAVVAVMLLFILPARMASGPFRGLTVTRSGVPADASARKARHECKHPKGLPKGAPCRIEIPAIGVDAVVIKLGLRGDGTLDIPSDYSETGWWSGGPKPGQIGSTVIVGHVDNRIGPAVFFHLPKLKAGDTVTVSRVKMPAVRYVIEDLGVWQKSNFPSEIVYGPTSLAELRLITCGGAFNRSTGHYVDNIIAFGRMVGFASA
jgi:sortase (surface protein transpeptidase)